MRARFLIDGFNVYHSLKAAGQELDNANGTTGCKGTRWLDLNRLCDEYCNLIGMQPTTKTIRLFTAYANHRLEEHPQSVANHKSYLKAMKDSGVRVHISHFRKAGREPNTRYEEKGTDASIAAHLILALATDTADAVIVVTGDTDIAPVLKLAKEEFPTKALGALLPYERHNRQIVQSVDHSVNASHGMYQLCQLPDRIRLSNGEVIIKPSTW